MATIIQALEGLEAVPLARPRPKRLLSGGIILVGIDLVSLLLSFVIATYFRPLDESQFATRAMIMGLIAVALITAFRYLGHYARCRSQTRQMSDMLMLIFAAFATDACLSFLFQLDYARTGVMMTWLVALFLVPAARFGIVKVMLEAGWWRRPLVIVGTGKHALATARAFQGERLHGYELVAVLDPDAQVQKISTAFGKPCPVIPLSAEATTLPSSIRDVHLTVALDPEELTRHADLVRRLSLIYGDLDLVTPIDGLPVTQARVVDFFGHDTLALRLRNNLTRPFPRMLKRVLDVSGALAGLVMLSPGLAWIAWRIKREDGGPILYGHTRIGEGGRPFKCLKFRSMHVDSKRLLEEHLANDATARAEWEATYKLKNDPRITGIGGILRATSLDELPQLWNVLVGEMSLVGPRPVVLDELVRFYGNEAGPYLMVKPGMTGLWQIGGRSDVDYEERVRLDSWYVRNWTVWHDLTIIYRTVGTVLFRKGAY